MPFYLAPSTAPTASPNARAVPQKNFYLAPSTAPKITAPRSDYLRKMSPEAARALRLKKRVDEAIIRGQRVSGIRKEEDDGGILGAITAPFRIGGEVLGNLAGEASQIIPGIARLGYEVGKNTVQAATGPIPGVPWSGRDAVGRLGKIGANIVNSVANDIRFVGKPILQGNIGELAKRTIKEPLRVAGTAALVYPIAGAAVSGGLKAGSVAARASGASQMADRLAAGASRKTVAREGEAIPRRQREPEVIEQPAFDSMGREVPNRGEPVLRQRRPRSANPITREIQRVVNDRVVAAIREVAGVVPLRSKGRNLNPMAPANRYNRIVAKDARHTGVKMISALENDAILGTSEFSRITRSLPKLLGSKENAKIAGVTAAIRAMGLNNLSSVKTSRTWGRDSLIVAYKEAKEKTENPLNKVEAQQNIDALSAIPPHWLDPAKAPKVINDLTKASIDVLKESTVLKEGTGLLSAATAKAAGYRSQAVAAGIGEQFFALETAKRAIEDAAKEAIVLRGKEAGLTAELVKAKAEAAARGGADEDAALRIETLTNDIRSLATEIRGKEQTGINNVRDAAKLQAEVDLTLGPEMEPGVYFPNVRKPEPGIIKRKRLGLPLGKQTPRMTPRREMRNKGIILRDGSAAFGPEVTLYAFRNALDTVGRQRAVESLLSKYVVKGADGLPITGDAAIKLAEQSSDLYVSRSKMQLIRTLSAKQEKSPEARALYEAAIATDDVKYLIPKSVEVGWRQALAPKRNRFDELNTGWKAGVLALSPRWYIQNMIGMSAQFALGAGLDLQAIRMATSRKYRDLVIAEIEGHGLASDLGEYVRREGGQVSTGAVTRVVNFGYKWNSRFESIPRRAMYFHALKKKLRDEEMVSAGASSAHLAEAWLGVIEGAKRGEKWADDLIGQATLETERFMGNYVRYNEFERAVLRRAFPFYGWMRAVHRLAFALPVKYPKRAALLFSASRMAYEMYNDNESVLMDPIQGLVIGGGTYLGTSSSNPADVLTATRKLGTTVARDVQTGNYGRALGDVAASVWEQMNPLVTALPTVAMNQTPIGSPLNFGTGGDIFTDPQSGRSYTIDPNTGAVVDAENRLGVEQIIGRNFPIYNWARRAIAGGTPTDSAGIGDLAAWRLRGSPASGAADLVVPQKPGGQALEKDWRYDATNLVGFPLYRYNPRNALVESVRDEETKLRAFEAQLKKKIEAEAYIARLGVR